MIRILLTSLFVCSFATSAMAVSQAPHYRGKSDLYRMKYDQSVMVLNIEGSPARAIYDSLTGKAIDLGSDGMVTLQKVGANVSCIKIEASERLLEDDDGYSCQINLREGVALPGAAG
jgi:hypothetical protein